MSSPQSRDTQRQWRMQIAASLILGRGLPREFWRDVFHCCMTLSWPRLLLAFLLVLLGVNLTFAGLYALVVGSALRVANTRHNYLSDATVKMWVIVGDAPVPGLRAARVAGLGEFRLHAVAQPTTRGPLSLRLGGRE